MSEQTMTTPTRVQSHAASPAPVTHQEYPCPAWCDRTYCSDVEHGSMRYHRFAFQWTDFTGGYGEGTTAYQVDLMWAPLCDVDSDMANAVLYVADKGRDGRECGALSAVSPHVARQLARDLLRGAQMLDDIDSDAVCADQVRSTKRERRRARHSQLARRRRVALGR